MTPAEEVAEIEKLRTAIRDQFNEERSDDELRALVRKHARDRDIMKTIQTIDHSRTIVDGNADDLLRVLNEYEKPGGHRQFGAHSGRQHSYQLLVLRAFHNFLASARATKEHAQTAMRRLRAAHPNVAPTYQDSAQRFTVHDHVELARLVRNSSLHVGPQAVVLRTEFRQTQDVEEWRGTVCFDTRPLRQEWTAARAAATKQQKKDTADAVLALLQRRPEMVTISGFVHSYMGLLTGFLIDLRQSLVNEFSSMQPRTADTEKKEGTE